MSMPVSTAASKRYSVHSLTSDVIPEWLCEGTFTPEEVGRPPSYLFSSIQQALSEAHMDGPPAYDHLPPKDEPTLPSVPSDAVPSIQDDESMWTEESSDWGTEEDEESFVDFQDGIEGPESDGGSTILNVPISQSHPTSDQEYDIKSQHTALPPAYTLRHLDDDKTEKLYVPQRLGTPDLALQFCLSGLEDELVNSPFSVFTDVCYEAAVLGDPRPPSPQFSPPLARASALHIRSRSAGSRKCPTLAEVHEGSDDEDDEVLMSPVQAYSPPPLIWDAREQQSYLSRRPSRNDLASSSTHLPSSLMFAKENMVDPPIENSAAHVASLFLRAPIPVKAQDSINSYPTRPPQPPPTANSGVRGLLRSLNLAR